jgi:prealbumin domain-containing protein
MSIIFASSFDSASPYAVWTSSGGASIVTGRHGSGTTPGPYVDTSDLSAACFGLGCLVGTFQATLNACWGKGNGVASGLFTRVQSGLDGRLYLDFNTPAGSPPVSSYTTVVLNQGAWYYIELYCSCAVTITASGVSNSTATYVITYSLYINNQLVLNGSTAPLTTGAFPNADIADFTQAGNYNRFILPLQWISDDVYINATELGDSYVHSDDATVEQVTPINIDETQVVLEVARLHEDILIDETQVVLEVIKAPVVGPTLALNKTVVGGTATPSQFTIAATGPSNSLSGPGSVPATPVTPGTFQLSETGPANYKGTWNCGPAVMPTPTSVVVPASGTSSAPVQVGGALYRPPLSGIGPYYFQIGSNLYQILCSSAGIIGVFKRAAANIGGSWTQMNTSGSPDQGNQSGYYKCTLDPTGTKIQIAYLTTGQLNIKICSYNTVPDTFGPATGNLTVPSALSTFAFVQRSDLTFVIVAGAPSVYPLYYVTNTGGLWGPITLLASNSHTVIDGIIDSFNTIHFIFNTVTFGCAYQKLDATYALIFPLAPICNAITLAAGGYPSILLWGSYIVIAAIDTAGPSPNAVQVFLGTPIATPIFIGSTIKSPSGSETLSYPTSAIGSDGRLNVFYADTDYTVPKVQISQSIYNGTIWGAPTQFYDALGNPPTNAPVPSSQVIGAIGTIQLAPQGWTGAVALETTTPASTGEFIEFGASLVNVVCTIINTYVPPGPKAITTYPITCTCG